MTNTTTRHQVKFDGTINLGNLIAAGAMLASGFLAYGNLDKRTDMNTAAITAASAAGEASEARLMAAIDKVAVKQEATGTAVAAIQLNVAVLRDRTSTQPPAGYHQEKR